MNRPTRLVVSRLGCLLLGLLATGVAGAGSPQGDDAAPTYPAAGADDIAWLNRVTFGVDSATLERYRQLGRQGFLDQQLRAAAGPLPPGVARQIDAMQALHTPAQQLTAELVQMRRELKSMREAGGDKGTDFDDARMAYRKRLREVGGQAAQAEMLRAVYDPNQLREQMVWFWLNHFNVYGRGPAALYLGDYTDRVLRPHALGRFRDLVMATLKSPAMLLYLNNVRNQRDHTNENYARELMELHTLGVGSGYTQADVQAMAHILTGVGLDLPLRARRRPRRMQGEFVSDGVFAFNPRRHDFSDQQLLGQPIAGGGFDEVQRAVDRIVSQPACARFVSTELARYFVADQPPPALIDRMTRAWQRSDGDIAEVLRALFTAPELPASYGHKFKDPMQFLVSSLRLIRDGRPLPSARPLLLALNAMSEPLFGRRTPDGWPLVASGWDSSGQLSQRFAVARALGGGGALRKALPRPGRGGKAGDATADTAMAAPQYTAMAAPADATTDPLPAARRRPPAIADSTLYRVALEPRLSANTRATLAGAHSVAEWNTYLLSSPEFNYR